MGKGKNKKSDADQSSEYGGIDSPPSDELGMHFHDDLYWFVRNSEQPSGKIRSKKKRRKRAKKLGAALGGQLTFRKWDPDKDPSDKKRESRHKRSLWLLNLHKWQSLFTWANWRDKSYSLGQKLPSKKQYLGIFLFVLLLATASVSSICMVFYDAAFREWYSPSRTKAISMSLFVSFTLVLGLIYGMVFIARQRKNRWTNHLLFSACVGVGLGLLLLRLSIVSTLQGVFAALGWAILETSPFLLAKAACTGLQKASKADRKNRKAYHRQKIARDVLEDSVKAVSEQSRAEDSHIRYVDQRTQLADAAPRIRKAMAQTAIFAQQGAVDANRAYILGLNTYKQTGGKKQTRKASQTSRQISTFWTNYMKRRK